MYILTNAIKNIWKNKGRNLLIGVIILTIISSTVVAFSISSTTKQIINNYKDRFGSEVTVSLDFDKLMSENNNSFIGSNIDFIDNDMYFKLSKSEHLMKSILNTEIGGKFKDLKAVDEDESNSNSPSGNFMLATNTDENELSMEMPTLRLMGSSNLSENNDFKNGIKKLVEGEYSEEKDSCIISKDLAELNGIKIGDYVDIETTVGESKEIKLKVTGIYVDSEDPYGNLPFKQAYMNRRNEVYGNFDTVYSLYNNDNGFIDAKFYLKSPELLEEFETEARELGVPDSYKVTTDEASYNNIVKPVESLMSVVNVFITVVLILGSIILILLNTISLRERKYEIGVLRAMGMKKNKVVLGFISESFIITIICLCIGTGIGGMASKPTSNLLLEKQIETQQDITNGTIAQSGVAIMSSDSNPTESIQEINAQLDVEALSKVAGVSLLLVLVSSCVGVRYITQYEPIKILTERS